MEVINVFQNVSTDEKISILITILERIKYNEESRNLCETVDRQEGQFEYRNTDRGMPKVCFKNRTL